MQQEKQRAKGRLLRTTNVNVIPVIVSKFDSKVPPPLDVQFEALLIEPKQIYQHSLARRLIPSRCRSACGHKESAN